MTPAAYRTAIEALGLGDEPWRALDISRATHFRYAKRGAPDHVGLTLRLIQALGPERARAVLDQQRG